MLKYLVAHPYQAYVLVMVSLANLINQMDRYLYSSNAPPFITKPEFDSLSGPLFTVTFTITGVLLSIIAGRWNKSYVLAGMIVFWSVMTGAVGFTSKFWQVALVRVGQSIGEAGCTPFAAGLIAAYFPAHIKGTAMSVYQIGMYVGFSLAQSVATTMTADTGHWQGSYYLCGGFGIAFAVVFALTVREQSVSSTPTAGTAHSDLPHASVKDVVMYWSKSPSLILLSVAGGVRNAGGFVWGYQVKNWFVRTLHVTDNAYSIWMLWIPLVGGSLGVMFGGFISDKLVNRKRADGSHMGVHGRLLVIIVCLITAAPFGAGALLAKHPVPLGFLSLIPVNVIGEMWVGVCITVILELTPRNMHTTSIALYQFITVNIGGNAPALVTPLETAIGGAHAFRTTLLMLYPGTYAGGAVLFFLVYFVVSCDLKRVAEYTQVHQAEGDAGQPLLAASDLVVVGNSEDDENFAQLVEEANSARC